MNCSDYRDSLSAYADGVLEPGQSAALEVHLQTCADCRQELTALKEMVLALRTMAPPRVPDLLPAIHERLQPTPWWQRFFAPWPVSLPWHGLALATTALLVVLVMHPQLSKDALRNQIGSDFDHDADKPIMLVLAKADNKTSLRGTELSEGSKPNPVVDHGRVDQFKNESVPSEPQTVELDKRAYLAGTSSVTEETIPSFRKVTGETEIAEQLGASVDLASAGSGGGFVSDHRERDESLVAASGGYLLSVPVGAVRSKSAFKEVAQRGNLEERLMDQLIGSPENSKKTEKLVVALKADQEFANPGVFQVQRFSSGGPASNAPELLQVRWQVNDADEAVARVTDWANAHQGFVTGTTPNHLSVMLPGSEASAFLQKFSSGTSALPTTDPFAAWVTISLELVPPQ